MVGHLSVADSQIVYYKQLLWLARRFETKRTSTTETLVETTQHEHYEYDLGNATQVPENPGNPPVF